MTNFSWPHHDRALWLSVECLIVSEERGFHQDEGDDITPEDVVDDGQYDINVKQSKSI